MNIQYTSSVFAESYCQAVDAVARERKYLGSTEGFPLESTVAFVQMIEAKNLAQYYAIENNRVVGWCDIIPKHYEGLNHVGVLGMGLLPDYRGKGLGRVLLTKTIGHACDINHLEKVELEVFESNITAISLYCKLGFTLEGKREHGRKLDGVYDNILLMSRFLIRQ
ncbi:MAG: ywnH [Bacteroidetes bacterium]|nr:ywnH [Bacteroidota bacterium]